MTVAATWKGTTPLRNRLLAAIARNCDCAGGPPCTSHRMLSDDSAQRVLDHLLFAYQIRDRLIIEEWRPAPIPTRRLPRRGRRGPVRARLPG